MRNGKERHDDDQRPNEREEGADGRAAELLVLAERIITGYPTREALAAASTFFILPPGSAQAVYSQGTGAGGAPLWTSTASGVGINVGRRPAGFDTVGFRFLPDNESGTLEGVWIGVRRVDGQTDPALMPLVWEQYHMVDDYRRDAPLVRSLPFLVRDDDDPEYFVEVHLVGKDAQFARNDDGPGFARYTEDGKPSDNPPHAPSTGAVEVYLGRYVFGSDGRLRLSETGVRALARHGIGSNGPALQQLRTGFGGFFDLEAVWSRATGGYAETFPEGTESGLSSAGTMFSAEIDAAALGEGPNAGRVGFVPGSAPVTLLRVVGLLDDIDGTGGVLFDHRVGIESRPGALAYHDFFFAAYDLSLDGLAGRRLHVLTITDQPAQFPGKAGVAGRRSYVADVPGAVFASEPWALLRPDPIEGMVAYLRLGRVADVRSRRRAFYGPLEAPHPQRVSGSKRWQQKVRSLVEEGTATWGSEKLSLRMVTHGWSQAGTLNWRNATLDHYIALAPALVRAGGFWTARNAKLPSLQVTTTNAGAAPSILDGNAAQDDGRAVGFDGSVRLHRAGHQEWAFGGVGIGRIFLWVDERPAGGTLLLRDVTGGADALLLTMNLHRGDGAALYAYVFPDCAPRTLRLERRDDGAQPHRTRSLAFYYDTNGAHNELQVSILNQGGSFLYQWHRLFAPSAAFPLGRQMHLYGLESVGYGGSTPGLRAPLPDLIRWSTSPHQDGRWSDDRVRAEQAYVRDIVEHTQRATGLAWGDYPSDVMWMVPPDVLDEAPFPAGRGLLWDALQSVRSGHPVTFVDFEHWPTYHPDPKKQDPHDLLGDSKHFSPRGGAKAAREEREALVPHLGQFGTGRAANPTPVITGLALAPEAPKAGARLTLAFEVSAPGGSACEVEVRLEGHEARALTQTTPGRWQARFADLQAGTWHLHIHAIDGKGVDAHLERAIAVAAAP